MKKNTFKRITSFVLAMMMVLSGTQAIFADTIPHDYDESDITINKTATPLGDNEYKIQLSVIGKDIDTGKKADIILVIDNSGSMHTASYGGKTLAEITKDAANAFIDGVLTVANNSSGNVRVGVVKYGEQANARIFSGSGSWSSNWSNGLNLSGSTVYTSNNADAKSAVSSATTGASNVGTNTEGGFLMAQKVAGQKRSDAESIVIFMTDGMPTYRYSGTNDSTTNDSSGSQTSKDELNEAIDAAQALGANSKVYTVALLSTVTNTSNQAKLASNLLSLSPKKYTSNSNTNNIMPQVDQTNRWAATALYAEKYFPIFSGDNIITKMQEIYGTLTGTINALANGTVTDVIHHDFELTEDSIDYLEGQGVLITENGTTLEFHDIAANGTLNNLPEIIVRLKSNIYGTDYTNEGATYKFTLFGEDEVKTLDFPMPIVLIAPIANDDYYTVNIDTVLTVPSKGILDNDSPRKVQVGSYDVTYLVVENSYVTNIPTAEGGTAVVSSNGSFVYTPPSGFTGTDTFTYMNKITVSGGDDLNGVYLSNLATVTIYVNIPYTVEYYVDGELVETFEGSVPADDPVVNSVADKAPEGYVLDDEESTPLPFAVSGEDNVIKVYYVKDSQPEEPEEPEVPELEDNVIIVKHYTKTGSGAKVLYQTDGPIPVTTSATIYGADFQITISGFTFAGSTPESIDVYPRVTTESAIQEFVFELLYTKPGSSGGGGTGGGGGTVIPDPEVPLAELEKNDHFAYVIGYPEGDVRPLNNITREEVAMIFYRLLTDESRNQLLSDVNPFTDMAGHAWSNRAISTLYAAGIIAGYPDGTFRPSEPISRAEFATIAAKFDDLNLGNPTQFTDIFGHWAEQYITSSENKGWIKGYPDMTFKPEQDITRAEAMTLINNVLGRKVPAENIHPDAMFWPDNPSTEWYYEAVMEATNSHDYVMEEDGDELWTGMKANKVWP